MPVNLSTIRGAFCESAYLFTTSGFSKMVKRGITVEQVEEAICRDAPEIIEDYPEDPKGPACLILGWADLALPLHILVGYGFIAGVEVEVITVYEPDRREWHNHRVRRQ